MLVGIIGRRKKRRITNKSDALNVISGLSGLRNYEKERKEDMKAIILGGKYNSKDGVFDLVAEDGEHLCSHFCSGSGYAEGDLYRNRPERKELFNKKGITEFVWLEDSGISEEELLKRNKEWYEKHDH